MADSRNSILAPEIPASRPDRRAFLTTLVGGLAVAACGVSAVAAGHAPASAGTHPDARIFENLKIARKASREYHRIMKAKRPAETALSDQMPEAPVYLDVFDLGGGRTVRPFWREQGWAREMSILDELISGKVEHCLALKQDEESRKRTLLCWDTVEVPADVRERAKEIKEQIVRVQAQRDRLWKQITRSEKVSDKAIRIMDRQIRKVIREKAYTVEGMAAKLDAVALFDGDFDGDMREAAQYLCADIRRIARAGKVPKS